LERELPQALSPFATHAVAPPSQVHPPPSTAPHAVADCSAVSVPHAPAPFGAQPFGPEGPPSHWHFAVWQIVSLVPVLQVTALAPLHPFGFVAVAPASHEQPPPSTIPQAFSDWAPVAAQAFAPFATQPFEFAPPPPSQRHFAVVQVPSVVAEAVHVTELEPEQEPFQLQ
jgi:hypothetical protein